MEKAPILYLIIPCYNEEKVLPITAPTFLSKLEELISKEKISNNSRILFVNDGSRDAGWDIINALSRENPHFIGISQSRNRGHQSSLLAGLSFALDKCDITVSVDCDGQDDINAVELMVDEYLKGCEIVYGVRNDRKTDTVFKRLTAEYFYKFMRLLGAEVIFNHADYRLISNRALTELLKFKEVNIYLRGIVPLVGFKSTSVYYKRTERLAGKSHYPFKKMLSLAFDGITSLSVRPIRIITVLGFIIALLSFIGVIWAVISHFTGGTIAGWASTVSIICFMGGIQLLSIGVIGEYIGKIYLETKQRPRFIISDTTDNIKK